MKLGLTTTSRMVPPVPATPAAQADTRADAQTKPGELAAIRRREEDAAAAVLALHLAAPRGEQRALDAEIATPDPIALADEPPVAAESAVRRKPARSAKRAAPKKASRTESRGTRARSRRS